MLSKLLYMTLPGEIESDLTDVPEAPWDPIPCSVCGRPASPVTLTEHGAVCDRCLTTDPGPAGAMALLDRTALRLIAARAALALEALTLAGSR